MRTPAAWLPRVGPPWGKGTAVAGLTIFFDDLQHDGKSEEFSTDPGWVGSGNHATFSDREQGGAHDFGFSAQTSHAGGYGVVPLRAGV